VKHTGTDPDLQEIWYSSDDKWVCFNLSKSTGRTVGSELFAKHSDSPDITRDCRNVPKGADLDQTLSFTNGHFCGQVKGEDGIPVTLEVDPDKQFLVTSKIVGTPIILSQKPRW